MQNRTCLLRRSLVVVAVAVTLSSGAAARAPGPMQDYRIPAQDLSSSIREVVRRSGTNVIVPSELVSGRSAPAVEGTFTAEQAIRLLIEGTGLVVTSDEDGIVIQSAVRGETPPPAGTPEDSGGDTILVTGTRIRGETPAGSSLVTLDRKAIERSGYATAQQLLQSVPQNFGGGPGESTSGVTVRNGASANVHFGSSVNLRGLGASSTLVLLNGSRPPLGGFSGVFADVSLIPLSAVERIEILPDGASAIYGSDAVAGVVNIVPRTRFRGAELMFRGGTGGGDFGELQLAGIVGVEPGPLRLMLSYEYYERSRLKAEDRAYATDDLRSFGGPDFRSGYASPGTILADGRTFAIPSGQDGRSLSADRLRPDQVNRGDGWTGTDILPDQSRHAAYGHAVLEIADGFDMHAEGLFAERRYVVRQRPISLSPRTVPTTNPFYVDPVGTGQPVDVQYDFREDLGSETQSGRVRAYGGTIGATARLGGWALDARAGIGVEKDRSRLDNLVNSARLDIALADTSAATAYNLFGDGRSTARATIDGIRGYTSERDHYRRWTIAAKADGPLLRLPRGDARVAVGGEYREEKFTSRSLSYRSSLAPVPSETPFPSARRITAGFAELSLPLVGEANPIPLVARLDLSLAGRIEHYSDFGTTTNPKLGVSYSPGAGVTLRATYGTSFRAPLFDNLRQDPDARIFFALPLADPSAPGGITNALVLRGNDPGLGPERATTWTAGADLAPRFLPGLRLAGTWFHTRYRDRIADPSSQLFSILTNRATYAPLIQDDAPAGFIASIFADPAFVDFSGLSPTDVHTVIDLRLQNLAVVTQSGLDVELGYERDFAGGTLSAGIAGTRLFEFDQAVTESAPAAELLNTLGNPVDLRWRARASWSDGRFSAAAFLNHVRGYDNTTVTPAEKVESWTTLDVQLGLAITDPDRGPGMRISLNATNLFDRDPPYVTNFNGLNAVGYDPENANPLGRVISLQVTGTW